MVMIITHMCAMRVESIAIIIIHSSAFVPHPPAPPPRGSHTGVAPLGVVGGVGSLRILVFIAIWNQGA